MEVWDLPTIRDPGRLNATIPGFETNLDIDWIHTKIHRKLGGGLIKKFFK